MTPTVVAGWLQADFRLGRHVLLLALPCLLLGQAPSAALSCDSVYLLFSSVDRLLSLEANTVLGHWHSLFVL